MNDTPVIIVAIFLAAILMFVFPLMTMADKKDDVTQLQVQTATTEFTNEIRTSGTITQIKVDNFIETLAATGNAYDFDITLQILDENPEKKSNGAQITIGDNVYYVMYTTQVLDAINNGATLKLKEGDIVSVAVKIKGDTIAGQFKKFLFRITGDNSAVIVGEESGIVTTTAK